MAIESLRKNSDNGTSTGNGKIIQMRMCVLRWFPSQDVFWPRAERKKQNFQVFSRSCFLRIFVSTTAIIYSKLFSLTLRQFVLLMWSRPRSFQDQTSTHTLHYKPTFIPKYFSKKSTKTPFGGHFVIIWLNGSFFMMRCSKSSLIEKKMLCRK